MHKETKKNISLGIAVTSLLISTITYGGAKGQNKLASPVVEAQETVTVTTTPTATPEPTVVSSEGTVIDYIREVFGQHSDKALLLLKGTGPDSCAENRNLDPKAVNDNRVWKGTGRDVNIFQINDVFHPVKELNLENDWKANIRYAKKMFDNDGGTFSKRWTCGKWYKSLGYDI